MSRTVARLRAGLIPFAVLVLAAGGLTACRHRGQGDAAKPQESNVIKIGEVGSMTGNEASFGISTHRGLTLALNEINSAGGIRGKKLEAVSLDDQGKPDEAATAVTKLITQDHIVALIGEVASSRSIAMAPIAQQYKIPMISPASTNPKVTEQGDFIFRACFIDPFQGAVMAKFTLNTLKKKKVAILRDVKNDYSVGLADVFIETFKKGGGQIVTDVSYSAGDTDFASQLTKIRALAPDAIFLPGYYTEVGLIARKAKALGMTMPLLGGDGWDSPRLIEIGGEALNGSYFSNHYSSDDTSPAVQNFVKKYKAAYNEIPDSMAVLGYDAILVLADAMKRAADTSGPALRDAIAATKDFPAVSGKISIDANRNPVKSAAVLTIENKAYKFVQSVAP
jgi:branched-chain amino acid transport system substrate-binding protein